MLVRGISTTFLVVRSILNRVRYTLLMLIGSLLLAAICFSVAEQKSLWDSVWWAVVSGWTVGYGDIFPVTTFGRLLAIVYIAWFNLLWIIVTAHVLAAVLVDKNAFTSEEQETMKATLLEIGQRLGVIDQARTTLPTAKEWAEAGHYTPQDDSAQDEGGNAFGVLGDDPGTN